MLSIFGKKTRPYDEMNAIVLATSGHEEKTLKKWQKISTANSDNIHIIISGEIEFRRTSDDLCMFTLQGQCIFGLSAIFIIQPYARRGTQQYGCTHDQ